MALTLRLRRALAAASLLRPGASASRSLPLAPLVPPLPRPHLPGTAAGFRSTAAATARGGDYGGGGDVGKISPDEILFEGCDYNHWLITMEFPDPKPSREEMTETYLQTLAKVVGSTTTYTGFQAVMTEEMSEKFRGLPGVVFILPDSYLYPETKEYGGDKYDNGVITPRPPPVHYSRSSRTDRNRNFRGNYQNSPPLQGNYQNSPPQQGNYQNSPPQQDGFRTYRPQQDGRDYAPQQNYEQAGQGGRGYGRNDYADRSSYSGPPGGYQGPSPQYQGQVNQAGQGQGYYKPQELRNFSQGQAGDFRPGGPSAPGTYGQPSAPRNYGQPPAQTYSGGNYEGPGVNPGYGGDNRQGAGPAYGGDNWQGGSGQYPSEGQQGNWQGRQ